jgi:hypothetical protein
MTAFVLIYSRTLQPSQGRRNLNWRSAAEFRPQTGLLLKDSWIPTPSCIGVEEYDCQEKYLTLKT